MADNLLKREWTVITAYILYGVEEKIVDYLLTQSVFSKFLAVTALEGILFMNMGDNVAIILD